MIDCVIQPHCGKQVRRGKVVGVELNQYEILESDTKRRIGYVGKADGAPLNIIEPELTDDERKQVVEQVEKFKNGKVGKVSQIKPLAKKDDA